MMLLPAMARDLPLELEREIFELAALSSSKPEQLNLMLVARKVHTWLSPIFYRTLIVHDFSFMGSKLQQLATQTTSNPGLFHRAKPRALYLYTSSKPDACISTWNQLRPTFNNLQSLFLASTIPLIPSTLETILTFPNLHHLTLRECWKSLPQACLTQPARFPALRSITHLRFTSNGPKRLSALDGFKSLTYLAFHMPCSVWLKPPHVIQLSRLEGLKVLVLTTGSKDMMERRYRPQCWPRIVVLNPPVNELLEWEKAGEGNGGGLWEEARRMVRARMEFLKWAKENAAK